jgi:uncharacterized protein (TIGR02246 family)
MRIRKLYVALGLGVALAVGLPLADRQDQVLRADPAKVAVEPGKGKRADEFIAAFNKGDAKAVAEFWLPDGDYIDQSGREIKGRAAIEKLYEKVFAGQKGAKLSVTVTSAHMVSDDVGLEDGITEVTPADGGPGAVARFSAVLVRKDGVWYFASVRDAVAVPPSNVEHLEGLDWLVGEWKGEAEKGESSVATYTYAENQNFLVSSFATTLNGTPIVGGTQWIGWDVVDKAVRSWSFYSGGGFGSAVWAGDGDKWTIKTTAQSADGKKLTATNVLTRIDADTSTWQVTQLTVDGVAIPDHKAQTLKRVK